MNREGYVSVLGKDIYYKFINYCKGKPVIVLFHDALGSVQQWKEFPIKLSEALKLPCLIYDRHGHGLSGTSPFPYKTEKYLENEAWLCFLELIDKLSVSEPLVLVGHSDGGSIALIVSAIIPKVILGTVCIAGHVFVEDIALKGIRDASIQYKNTDMKKKLEVFHADKAEALFNSWHNTWLSPFFSTWSIESYLKDVACPVLVVQGANDEYATVKQVAAIEMGLGGKSKTWIIPGCGHMPHKEQPDQTIHQIAGFCKEFIPYFNDLQI